MKNTEDITLFLISCARFEIEKYNKYIYIYYKRLPDVNLNLYFSFLDSNFIVTHHAKKSTNELLI